MVERESTRVLQGDVVIDDAYLGDKHQGKAGRDSENKVPFVAAVELSKEGHPLVARFDRVKGFSTVEIGQWAKHYLSESIRVVSDGLNCFPAVTEVGAIHLPEVVGKGRSSIEMPCFSWINILLGNLKTALTGTYHAFKFRKYAHRYLAQNINIDLIVGLRRQPRGQELSRGCELLRFSTNREGKSAIF